MILVFDTETTGKPKNYKAPVTDLNNWPRITQLAWQLYTDEGALFDESCKLIKPDGWEIPKEEFFIKNNMSTLRCDLYGVPIHDALLEFISPLERCHTLVAHNMAFDENILGAEVLRTNLRPANRPKRFCTMLASKDVCRIPGPFNDFKWPSLIEIHRWLFQEDFTGAHDALVDVRACARVFFELKKRQLVTL